MSQNSSIRLKEIKHFLLHPHAICMYTSSRYHKPHWLPPEGGVPSLFSPPSDPGPPICLRSWSTRSGFDCCICSASLWPLEATKYPGNFTHQSNWSIGLISRFGKNIVDGWEKIVYKSIFSQKLHECFIAHHLRLQQSFHVISSSLLRHSSGHELTHHGLHVRIGQHRRCHVHQSRVAEKAREVRHASRATHPGKTRETGCGCKDDTPLQVSSTNHVIKIMCSNLILGSLLLSICPRPTVNCSCTTHCLVQDSAPSWNIRLLLCVFLSSSRLVWKAKMKSMKEVNRHNPCQISMFE